MSTILSIETSTQTCSVCISKEGKLLNLQSFSEHFSHTEIITTLVQKCIDESCVKFSDLDAVALSKGPGSYTALRVGTSTAKGLCFGLDIPLIAIDTLEVLALASDLEVEGDNNLYIPSIDARRMEVFTSFWSNNDGWCEIKPMHPLILEKETFYSYSGYDNIVFSGDCQEKIQTMYSGKPYIFTNVVPCSKHLIKIAHDKFTQKDFVNMAEFSPVYAKAPNITTPKKQL